MAGLGVPRTYRGKKVPTAEQVRDRLNYDPETGVFTWRYTGGSRTKADAVAGSQAGDGYWLVGIIGRQFKAHRLAWLHYYGEWPDFDIDHKNRVRDDNRIANLRACTAAQNLMNQPAPKNNTSGYKGVELMKSSGKWRARIHVQGRHIHLGCYNTIEAAAHAYRHVAIALHGEFARFD